MTGARQLRPRHGALWIIDGADTYLEVIAALRRDPSPPPPPNDTDDTTTPEGHRP